MNKTTTDAVTASILVVLAGIGSLGVLLFLPLFAPIIGAFTGFVVGWVFDDTSRAFLDNIGQKNIEMWQFGAMLAFVGAFFSRHGLKFK
jgi:hypothetical protein